MINKEKIHLELLNRLNQESAVYLQTELENVLKERENLIIKNAESLMDCIDQGMKHYKCLQEKETVGDICFVYLSFLYTGILENKIKYRLDFYDKNDRVSDIECSVNWEFPEFSRCIYKMRNYLEKEINIRAKEWCYEADSILYSMALSLRSLSDNLLREIWEEMLRRKSWDWYNVEKVKIMMGELFDEAELII